MSKIKHFQVKPEHVEAMQVGPNNIDDVVDWIMLFADKYKIVAKKSPEAVMIFSKTGEALWCANFGDWMVRSFINQYFYVEPDDVMTDQYIKL
jgi:hypothetical protein